MARMIDAYDLQRKLLGLADFYDSDYLFVDVVNDEIDNAKTVDAVEVVRCRDCKWYMPGDLFKDIMFCHRLKKENGKPAKYNFCEDDFCSRGERKGNV